MIEEPISIFGFRFRLKLATWRLIKINIGLIVLAYGFLFVGGRDPALFTMGAAAIGIFLQATLGFFGLLTDGSRLFGLGAMLGTPVMAVVTGLPLLFMFGGGWGRPLRIKGRQLHPELREGTDWTRGARPDVSGLNEATRNALAALWLHDAQKEHASVPAFSRISWMLAAVGAPAELMEWSHRAALEEIEHTRICFALAAGYGGKNWSVKAMPDLLLGGLDLKDDPVVVLASEIVNDGCQLEDFNADIAHACSLGCTEPATRGVLEQVAREERLHADFSWALLEWLYSRWPAKVRPVMEKALSEGLAKLHRPTAVSWEKLPLVQLADPVQMVRHGRLPDERWSELWDMRLNENRKRLEAMLAGDLKLAA